MCSLRQNLLKLVLYLFFWVYWGYVDERPRFDRINRRRQLWTNYMCDSLPIIYGGQIEDCPSSDDAVLRLCFSLSSEDWVRFSIRLSSLVRNRRSVLSGSDDWFLNMCVCVRASAFVKFVIYFFIFNWCLVICNYVSVWLSVRVYLFWFLAFIDLISIGLEILYLLFGELGWIWSNNCFIGGQLINLPDEMGWFGLLIRVRLL